MATPEWTKPRRVLVTVAAVIAGLAVGWLHEALMFGALLLGLVAMGEGFSAGGAFRAAVGVVTMVGTVLAVFGPVVRHWRPLSTWVTLVTATAFDLGVILVLVPP